MKKILLLIAAASLLFACDKTENEQDIMDAFFGYGNDDTRFRPEVYGQMQAFENVYLQEFTSAATSDWSEKNDDYSLQGHENGELIIRGKQNYYGWQNFSNLNQSFDFQMEMRVQFNFIAITAVEAYMGIVWGVNEDKGSFNYILLFSSNNHTMQIGNRNGSTYDNWYIQPSGLTKNTHHVYTIRKVGNTMYFFADGKYIYKTGYQYFQPNYGFWLTANGIVLVDYVRVDYIEAIYN